MFRTLGKSKIAFILAIVFGISLFFFKSGSRYSNLLNTDSVVAKVSGTPISTTKFNRTMKMNIDNFNKMLGKEITGDEIRSFQLHSLALGALINDAVFEDEFNDNNFIIDEKVIALKTKERIPQLYDENNKLNELYLNSFLKQQQLKIEDIVQIINFETRNEFFSNAFFKVNFPKHFSSKIENSNKQKRKISYIELNIDQVLINEINKKYSSNLNEELKKFYDENINNYLSVEKRDIEYLLIDKKFLSESFNPSSFEIKEYYDSNKELFFEDEKRSFIQFNFKTDEEAINFKKEVKNLTLNKTLTYAKNNKIFFNEFENLKKSEILNQIAEPLFKLNINSHSDIIKSSLAKHILILKSIKQSQQLTLNQVREKINFTIKKIETTNYYNNLTNQISENVLNGASIHEIASNFNIGINTIKDMTKNYSLYDKSKKIFFDNLIPSTFSSNKDFVSDIINIDENLSYVFNVTKIDSSKPIIFEKIKDKILTDWSNLKKIEKIKLDTIKNIKNTEYISNLSKEYNINIKKLVVSRNENKIPQKVINSIFESEKNLNIQNFNNDKFYIVKIDDIIIIDNKDVFQNISLNNDLRVAFGQEIMKNKKITTNDNLISAILEQY